MQNCWYFFQITIGLYQITYTIGLSWVWDWRTWKSNQVDNFVPMFHASINSSFGCSQNLILIGGLNVMVQNWMSLKYKIQARKRFSYFIRSYISKYVTYSMFIHLIYFKCTDHHLSESILHFQSNLDNQDIQEVQLDNWDSSNLGRPRFPYFWIIHVEFHLGEIQIPITYFLSPPKV